MSSFQRNRLSLDSSCRSLEGRTLLVGPICWGAATTAMAEAEEPLVFSSVFPWHQVGGRAAKAGTQQEVVEEASPRSRPRKAKGKAKKGKRKSQGGTSTKGKVSTPKGKAGVQGNTDSKDQPQASEDNFSANSSAKTGPSGGGTVLVPETVGKPGEVVRKQNEVVEQVPRRSKTRKDKDKDKDKADRDSQPTATTDTSLAKTGPSGGGPALVSETSRKQDETSGVETNTTRSKTRKDKDKDKDKEPATVATNTATVTSDSENATGTGPSGVETETKKGFPKKKEKKEGTEPKVKVDTVKVDKSRPVVKYQSETERMIAEREQRLGLLHAMGVTDPDSLAEIQQLEKELERLREYDDPTVKYKRGLDGRISYQHARDLLLYWMDQDPLPDVDFSQPFVRERVAEQAYVLQDLLTDDFIDDFDHHASLEDQVRQLKPLFKELEESIRREAFSASRRFEVYEHPAVKPLNERYLGYANVLWGYAVDVRPDLSIDEVVELGEQALRRVETWLTETADDLGFTFAFDAEYEREAANVLYDVMTAPDKSVEEVARKFREDNPIRPSASIR